MGGGERESRPSTVRVMAERQLLHAWKLGFFHPKTDAWMEFEAPLPADFTNWLEAEPLRTRHRKVAP